MTLIQLTDEVQVRFPIPFDQTFIYDDDNTMIDKIIQSAINKALSRYQKIESVEITGSTNLPNAVSVLRCIPAGSGDSFLSVFHYMPTGKGKLFKVKYWFNQTTKRLIVEPEGSPCLVTYVRSRESMNVEDLNAIYTEWTIDYAVALLNQKEGFLGTSISITELPFDLNYSQMLDEGREARRDLEEKLTRMHAGVLAIRAN